jgi:hypothetical protein
VASLKFGQSKLLLGLALASAFANISWASSFTGPKGYLYLSSGDGRIYVVHGTTVNSFPMAYGGVTDPDTEGAIAINSGECDAFGCTGMLETAAAHFWSPGFGGEYQLLNESFGDHWLTDVSPTGVTYFTTVSDLATAFKDGTSDGTYNYAVGHGDGTVYQTDLFWQNPVALFSAGGGGQSGITYDGFDNSLWVSGWGPVVSEYSMDGRLLRQFGLSTSEPGSYPGLYGLAFDSWDRTLWVVNNDGHADQYLEQYSIAGVLLQSGRPPGLPRGGFEGAEILAPDVPEPGALLLCGFGLALICARRRFHGA